MTNIDKTPKGELIGELIEGETKAYVPDGRPEVLRTGGRVETSMTLSPNRHSENVSTFAGVFEGRRWNGTRTNQKKANDSDGEAAFWGRVDDSGYWFSATLIPTLIAIGAGVTWWITVPALVIALGLPKFMYWIHNRKAEKYQIRANADRALGRK